MSAPPPHTPTYPTTIFLPSLTTSHGQASRPELVVFSRARLDPFSRGGHGQLTSGCSPQRRPGHLRLPVPMKAAQVTPTLGWFCSGTGWLMGPGDAATAHIYFPWLDAVVSRGQRAPRETAPPPPSISTSYQGLPIPAATLDSPAPVPSAPSSNLSPCPSASSAQEPVPGYARGKCACTG